MVECQHLQTDTLVCQWMPLACGVTCRSQWGHEAPAAEVGVVRVPKPATEVDMSEESEGLSGSSWIGSV